MDELFSNPDYSDFPLILHLSMLQDTVRMEAYETAIAETVMAGDTVVDIGAGTGVLSFIASNYAPRRVVAIDKNSLIHRAELVYKKNFDSNIVEFLKKDILGDDIERLDSDVAICELFGNFGIDENVIEVLARVREHLMKPGGKIIPQDMSLVVCPVQCTSAYREVANWQSTMQGLDFSAFQELAYNTVYQIDNEPLKLVASPKTITTIDFHTVRSLPGKLKARFKVETPGIIHGIAGWFRSRLSDNVILDTGPGEKPTHWGQVMFPIGNPAKVSEGCEIEFNFQEFTDENNSIWKWWGSVEKSNPEGSIQKFGFEASRRFYE